MTDDTRFPANKPEDNSALHGKVPDALLRRDKPEIKATELMEGHLIQRERVPGSAIQTRQVLYFRGDTVIKLLQERNDHLQLFHDQLAIAVAKVKARKALLDEAKRIISNQECRCHYYGDGEYHICARCDWLEGYANEPKQALKESLNATQQV